MLSVIEDKCAQLLVLMDPQDARELLWFAPAEGPSTPCGGPAQSDAASILLCNILRGSGIVSTSTQTARSFPPEDRDVEASWRGIFR